MAMSASGGQVVQFPSQAADTATILQNDKVKLIALGSQISTLVQHFNDLKQQLMATSSPTREQFAALLDQRKAALQQLMDAHQAAIAALRQKATEANVAIDITTPPVNLSGLGQLVDTASIQTQITDQQSKLTALQNYYTSYQAALAAGLQPPPMPPELAGGFFGMSGTAITIGIAAIVGAFLLFGKK
jgi:hypothetical protein